MSEPIPYHYEIGAYTGLPTASHAARYVLTHNVPLVGIIDADLFARKEVGQRSVPLISGLVDMVEEDSADVRVSSWIEAAEFIHENYINAVASLHETALTHDSPVINWLRSLALEGLSP
jgi:hypothetical protein